MAGPMFAPGPACGSSIPGLCFWDMFKDFEERGELFKRLVWALGINMTGNSETGSKKRKRIL